VPTFEGRGVSRGQRNGSPRPLISVFRFINISADNFVQEAESKVLQMTFDEWVSDDYDDD
jgi:hypothetical protein